MNCKPEYDTPRFRTKPWELAPAFRAASSPPSSPCTWCCGDTRSPVLPSPSTVLRPQACLPGQFFSGFKTQARCHPYPRGRLQTPLPCRVRHLAWEPPSLPCCFCPALPVTLYSFFLPRPWAPRGPASISSSGSLYPRGAPACLLGEE